MSATITVHRLTGVAGATDNDITGINTRADTFDSHTTADTANPIAIPNSGTNYSYWVVTRLNCDVAPAVVVNNLKWYMDDVSNPLGTGVTMKANGATGYTQATGSAGDGTQLTTGNYASLYGAPSDAFSFTNSSPLAVTGSTSSTGLFGDRVVYQIGVGSSAAAGATGVAHPTWSYDEI